MSRIDDVRAIQTAGERVAGQTRQLAEDAANLAACKPRTEQADTYRARVEQRGQMLADAATDLGRTLEAADQAEETGALATALGLGRDRDGSRLAAIREWWASHASSMLDDQEADQLELALHWAECVPAGECCCRANRPVTLDEANGGGVEGELERRTTVVAGVWQRELDEEDRLQVACRAYGMGLAWEVTETDGSTAPWTVAKGLVEHTDDPRGGDERWRVTVAGTQPGRPLVGHQVELEGALRLCLDAIGLWEAPDQRLERQRLANALVEAWDRMYDSDDAEVQAAAPEWYRQEQEAKRASCPNCGLDGPGGPGTWAIRGGQNTDNPWTGCLDCGYVMGAAKAKGHDEVVTDLEREAATHAADLARQVTDRLAQGEHRGDTSYSTPSEAESQARAALTALRLGWLEPEDAKRVAQLARMTSVGGHGRAARIKRVADELADLAVERAQQGSRAKAQAPDDEGPTLAQALARAQALEAHLGKLVAAPGSQLVLAECKTAACELSSHLAELATTEEMEGR